MQKRENMPRLQYLCDIHPRVHFCRNAVLVRLTGGLDRLVCRQPEPGESKERYDLYLNGVPLVETFIPGCGTCTTHLWAGYGDGLINEVQCREVRDRLNAGYDGLKTAVSSLAPFVGLMKSGYYAVADFDLFPVSRSGKSCRYFWDAPEYASELHFRHYWPGGASESMDAPLFLAPTQRPSLIDPQRVESYIARLDEGERFPRAVALYLNGGVALLLDGHHKAAACAAAGVPVTTLVILPLETTDLLKEAISAQKRLFFHQTKHMYAAPLTVCDGQGNECSRAICLKTMEKRQVVCVQQSDTEWGRVPDRYRTERFMDFPDRALLAEGTVLPPDQIRTHISGQMKLPKGEHDMSVVSALRKYARLFPQSKWLSPSERAWLERPDTDFYW